VTEIFARPQNLLLCENQSKSEFRVEIAEKRQISGAICGEAGLEIERFAMRKMFDCDA
jgi:hypothetical protein